MGVPVSPCCDWCDTSGTWLKCWTEIQPFEHVVFWILNHDYVFSFYTAQLERNALSRTRACLPSTFLWTNIWQGHAIWGGVNWRGDQTHHSLRAQKIWHDHFFPKMTWLLPSFCLVSCEAHLLKHVLNKIMGIFFSPWQRSRLVGVMLDLASMMQKTSGVAGLVVKQKMQVSIYRLCLTPLGPLGPASFMVMYLFLFGNKHVPMKLRSWRWQSDRDIRLPKKEGGRWGLNFSEVRVHLPSWSTMELRWNLE